MNFENENKEVNKPETTDEKAKNIVEKFVSGQLENIIFWRILTESSIDEPYLFNKIVINFDFKNKDFLSKLNDLRTAFWNCPNSFQRPCKLGEGIDPEDRMVLEILIGEETDYLKQKTEKDQQRQKIERIY